MMRKPNILIILSDEQRYDTLGCTGNRAAQTPHLDRLAECGTVFDRCYTPFPLSCPARASLWTSRMPRNHHVIGNWRAIRPELRDGGLVADFAAAGYHTLYSGKWHVPGTTPARLGFEASSAIPAVLDGKDRGRYIEAYRTYAEEMGYNLVPGMIENLTPRDMEQLRHPCKAPCGTAEIALEHYIETWQTDTFLRTLDERPDDRPFFGVVSYSAPHFPMIVPEPYDRLIKPEEVDPPGNFMAPVSGKPHEIRECHYRRDFEHLPEGEWRRLMAYYYGFCSLVDTQVGKILRYLEKSGEADRTIVIYTTDHGDMMGSHGMFQKGHPMHYEETNRIPFLLRHPDLTGGNRAEGFVSLIDLMPTLADTAGVQLGSGVEGRSFRRLLEEPSDTPFRETVVSETYIVDGTPGGSGEYIDPERIDTERLCVNMSIRDESGKYVFHGRDHDEYYDLDEDPHELENRSGTPEVRIRETALRSRLFEEVRTGSRRLGEHMERMKAETDEGEPYTP